MPKLWYAVHTKEMREDGVWDNGTFDRDEALEMLSNPDEEYICIAVIDDEAKVCVEEIMK